MYWYYYDYQNHICYITNSLPTGEFAALIGIDPSYVARYRELPALNSGDRYKWIS